MGITQLLLSLGLLVAVPGALSLHDREFPLAEELIPRVPSAPELDSDVDANFNIRTGAKYFSNAEDADHSSRKRDSHGCSTLHIIAARGSNEPPGTGVIGAVANGVVRAVPGATADGLDYPATIQNYDQSEARGVTALQEAVSGYIANCSTAKIAIMGYSQGAQVAGDYLCGRDSSFLFDATAPVSRPTVDDHIVAVILMGDPAHAANQPWNAGNSTKDGIFARQNITACEAYAPKIRGYCDTGDRYCDRGSIVEVHRLYAVKYRDDAINFVLARYNESVASGTPSPTSSGSPTSTPSGTSPSQTAQPSRGVALTAKSWMALWLAVLAAAWSGLV